MRNPEESYLVKLGLFIACAAGATLSMYRNKMTWKWKWGRKLIHVVLGTFAAYYLTPVFMAIVQPYLRINENMLSSFGFLVGSIGFQSIDIVFDFVLFLINKFKKQ